MNFGSLKLLHQKNIVQGLPYIQAMKDAYERCALRKHHQQLFPKGVAWRAKNVLELVRIDFYGLMYTLFYSQNRYFLLFIYDYSKRT